jgi:hypothetical protein
MIWPKESVHIQDIKKTIYLKLTPSTLGNGFKTNEKDKAGKPTKMDHNSKVPLSEDKKMVREDLYEVMALYMRVNSRTTTSMERAPINGQMEDIILVIGSIIICMGLVHIFGKIGGSMRGSIRIIRDRDMGN